MQTNADILDPPRRADLEGQPKPLPICRLLRPVVSFLAHSCSPSCYLEVDFTAPGGGVSQLRAYNELRPGDELTRSCKSHQPAAPRLNSAALCTL